MQQNHISQRLLLPMALAAMGIGVLLIFASDIAVTGMRAGVAMCLNVLVPSLFPFLVLSQFMVKGKLCDGLGSLLAPVMRHCFHLPPCAASVVLMSLMGGYPVGSLMTAQLLREERLTQRQAKALLLFCVNPSPAFVITALGTVALGNTTAGLMLYASLAFSALLLGLLVGRTLPKPEKESFPACAPSSLTGSFVESVAGAASTLLGICTWVLLFSCVTALAGRLPLPSLSKLMSGCMLEVTSGTVNAAGRMALPFLAAALGFGGLCVHCQVAQPMGACRLPYLRFLFFRFLHGGLSFGLCSLLLRLFPTNTAVFSNFAQSAPRLVSSSLPASLAMILMSVLLILEVDRSKKIC